MARKQPGPVGTAAAPPRRSPHEEREELYRVQKVERAEGQDPPGTWGYFTFIAKRDPLLATVFVLLALNVVVNVGEMKFLGAIISAAVFWGVYTFQSWGFWIAMVGSALGVLLALAVLLVSPLWGAIFLAIPLFDVIVLWRRKDYFG